MFEEVLRKFIEAGVYPTKTTISEVLGFSVGTLRRKGIVVRQLQKEYKALTEFPTLCKYCQSPCSKYNKFCNHSCAATYNNSRKVTAKCKTCIFCNKSITGSGVKYCNASCQQGYAQEEFIRKWKSGEELCESADLSVPNRIRRYLFEKYESKCCKCGWCEVNPTSGKIPLEVEHIDGDSSNNKEENLILLCPNCHSLTSTYKGLNRGKGRHQRMTRYNQGKSY